MATIKILVVIPYLAEQAQGSELELAVTGWRTHFKHPYQIIVVGDWHPVTETGRDIMYIPCPRVDPVPGQYLPHLDFKNKFLKVRETFPRNKGFIYACDDCYAVKDFSLPDIQTPKYEHDIVEKCDWRNATGWLRDWYKTRDYCDLFRLPVTDWVTHLPIWYDFRKLLATFRVIPEHESCVWENLYYSFEEALGLPYPPQPSSLYKHEVMTASPDFRDVDDLDATWIVNGNCGWSRALEEKLRRHYGSLIG